MQKYKEYSNCFKGKKISSTSECANVVLLHQYGGTKMKIKKKQYSDSIVSIFTCDARF